MKMPQTVLVSLAFMVFTTIGFLVAWIINMLRQQHVLVAERNLASLNSQPTQPSLPAVLPAHLFDHSDKTPYVGNCPGCYGEWLVRADDSHRTADGAYVMPNGNPQFCARHRKTTLALAMARKATTR